MRAAMILHAVLFGAAALPAFAAALPLFARREAHADVPTVSSRDLSWAQAQRAPNAWTRRASDADAAVAGQPPRLDDSVDAASSTSANQPTPPPPSPKGLSAAQKAGIAAGTVGGAAAVGAGAYAVYTHAQPPPHVAKGDEGTLAHLQEVYGRLSADEEKWLGPGFFNEAQGFVKDGKLTEVGATTIKYGLRNHKSGLGLPRVFGRV